MMAANPLRDCFHYCWSIHLNETKDINALFFTEKDFRIEDTRDADFNKIENRLAYMNKFGHTNVTLVEKCVEDFFDQYFQENKNYFSENLKVCSLSNGPGIDIVGFLRALHKSKHPKCIPVLQAINTNDSWQDAYQNLISSTYKAYNSKFHESHSVLPPEKIQFMQCDIFSKLSPEAQTSISSCDILLMLKVFASTKATQGIFFDTVQKIFSRLKPGALIFFFGGKKNIKEITEKDSIKKYVKCLFGPKEMDLQKLSAYEIISKSVSLKPKLYGKVKFIVLLKKDIPKETDMNSSQNIAKSKKKKRNKRKKNKNAVVTPNSNGLSLNTTLNDSEEEDTYSESSYTCSSIQSETLSIQSQHLSHGNKFQSMPSQSVNDTNSAIEKKQSLNLPIESASPSKNMPLSFGKIHAEQLLASNLIKKDATSEKSLTGALPQNKLSLINNFLSRDGIAIKNVSTENKTSSQPDEPIKTHFTNDALSVIDMTSKKLEKTETVSSKQILPSVTLTHADLFKSPKMTACKQPVMQNASSDRSRSTEIPRIEECLLHMNSSSNNLEERGVKTSNVAKLAAPKQFQCDGKASTFSEQFVDATNNDDFHSMLQRCETLIISLERAVAGICTDMQSLRDNEVPTEEGCYGDICSALRNSHCCMHYNNFSGRSCCRKICHCMRTQSNSLSCPNYVRCTERINDTHTCRSETSSKPYLVIPVQHDDLSQIFSCVSR